MTPIKVFERLVLWLYGCVKMMWLEHSGGPRFNSYSDLDAHRHFALFFPFAVIFIGSKALVLHLNRNFNYLRAVLYTTFTKKICYKIHQLRGAVVAERSNSYNSYIDWTVHDF